MADGQFAPTPSCSRLTALISVFFPSAPLILHVGREFSFSRAHKKNYNTHYNVIVILYRLFHLSTPCFLPTVLHTLSHFILIATPWHMYHHHLYFTSEETQGSERLNSFPRGRQEVCELGRHALSFVGHSAPLTGTNTFRIWVLLVGPRCRQESPVEISI